MATKEEPSDGPVSAQMLTASVWDFCLIRAWRASCITGCTLASKMSALAAHEPAFHRGPTVASCGHQGERACTTSADERRALLRARVRASTFALAYVFRAPRGCIFLLGVRCPACTLPWPTHAESARRRRGNRARAPCGQDPKGAPSGMTRHHNGAAGACILHRRVSLCVHAPLLLHQPTRAHRQSVLRACLRAEQAPDRAWHPKACACDAFNVCEGRAHQLARTCRCASGSPSGMMRHLLTTVC